MSEVIKEPERMVFGVGTGRCGTESLSSLLRKQKLSRVTHERYRWRLGWDYCESHVDTILTRDTKKLKRNLSLYGDVAFSWLPYVPYILRIKPEAKIVCLKRDKQQTIKSWLNTPYNHWQEHDGRKYPYGHWSRSFPKFDSNLSRDKAIEAYWDMYYKRAEVLESSNPDSFKVFDLDVLNNLEAQKKLLNFVGIEEKDHIYKVGIRLNAAKKESVVTGVDTAKT